LLLSREERKHAVFANGVVCFFVFLARALQFDGAIVRTGIVVFASFAFDRACASISFVGSVLVLFCFAADVHFPPQLCAQWAGYCLHQLRDTGQ